MTFGAIVRDNKTAVHQSLLKNIPKDFGVYNRQIIAHRPLTPDGLPIIDVDSEINNLYYNTGHGFFGWTWIFASGKLISDIVDKNSEHSELLRQLQSDRFRLPTQGPELF